MQAYGNLTTGDIIGIAIDVDNNKLYFSKNGTWQNSGDPKSGATGTGALQLLPTDVSSGYPVVELIISSATHLHLTSDKDISEQQQ